MVRSGTLLLRWQRAPSVAPTHPLTLPLALLSTLLSTLLLATPWPARAAASARHPSRAVAAAPGSATVVNDFRVLATTSARPCRQDDAAPVIEGWSAQPAACAWQNRLSMRQWKTQPATGSPDCIGAPARWWAALFSRWGMVDHDTAWNTAWPAQSVQLDTAQQSRLAIVERMADGTWVATEWRWSPAPRAATRRWQQGRWNLLVDAGSSRRQKDNVALIAADAIPLFHAWETSRGAGAAEVGQDGWRWESAGLCMRMETAGISQAQLHLPYSREESRLEQRAAMQLRLARTYPKARWLSQFSMLPVPETGTAAPVRPHAGATYEALWLEDHTVKGQLWIPQKSGDAIHRARISVPLPAAPAPKEDDPRVLRIVTAIKQALGVLANRLAQDHER